ncbi:MAG: UDP-N-acetylmuramoyl-tripeptide--D-alanyl-D-alanine ligase [Bdellovibrionota bacterium]|jgi:UDP-N-acetylmuramoyl-tripeptide--D-alanyl-D-alanine ligase
MKIEIKKLIEILKATPSNVSDFNRVLETALIFFDSRKLVSGGIFVAISTTKNDGALYIKDAMTKGAVLAIAESNPDNSPNVLLVEDSVKAFQELGKYVRSKYKGLVIGITGSSGKTTGKALIVQMLSAFSRVFAGETSFNNHIGTPYNLCRLDFDSDYAVFEMGMDHAGEISLLTELVKPNVAAVMNVFPMHIEYFKEFKDIAFAKAEIFEKTVHPNGKAIINADTNFAKEVLIPQAQKAGIKEIITFGKKGDITLKSCNFTYDGQTEVEIGVGDNVFKHRDNGLGERFAYNATFAVAVATALNLDIAKALQAISSFSPLKGRGKVSKITIPQGAAITLIDDSYNGQPEAVRQAIQTLSMMKCPEGARKIAIIGRMMELGESSEEEHRAVGRVLAESTVDIVIGIGEETKAMLAEVPSPKDKIFQESVDGLFEVLTTKLLKEGDIVLIKGSHYASRVFELSEKFLTL